ncbi:MAG TPA: MBL fold metallo-hydrolase [Gemmatimonadaceae bacterium]|nr:MBL fold metallo-hydrolase [Gemmatimonadaceae bacterium]
MRILSRTVGAFQENAYLVVDDETGDAVIVDPGADPDDIIAMIESSGATLRAVWITHAHLDHIGAISAIRRRYAGVPVHVHPLDRPVYEAQSVFAESYQVPFEQPDAADADLAHGDVMRVGNLSFDVIHLPGHSPGHVVFHGHGIVLGGDVLFAGSIGRTDLPMANPEHMQDSLRTIAALPPETVVYPGHGAATTIGAELNSNPFLNGMANVKRNAD